MPGALETNITASPMRLTTLAPPAAITSPVVDSNCVIIAPSCTGSSRDVRPGVPGQVREPHGQRDDVRRRRRRAHIRVPPPDHLEVMAVQRVERVGDAREQLTGEADVGARDVDELPVLHEWCFDVRADERDLGLRDLRGGRAERADRVHDFAFGDERGEHRHQFEEAHVGGREAALVRTGIAKTRRPPDPKRELGTDLRGLAHLRMCHALAVGPQRAERTDAEQAILLDRLHDLRDRRVELVEQIPVHREQRFGVGRVGVVQAGRDEIVELTHEKLPGSSMCSPASSDVCPIGSNRTGGSARSTSPAPPVAAQLGSSAGARSAHPTGRVPEERGAGAVPSQRERHLPAAAQWNGVHREILTQPVRREVRHELDPTRRLAREHLPQREQERRRATRHAHRVPRGVDHGSNPRP